MNFRLNGNDQQLKYGNFAVGAKPNVVLHEDGYVVFLDVNEHPEHYDNRGILHAKDGKLYYTNSADVTVDLTLGGGISAVTWGDISGTLSAQSDLWNVLIGKESNLGSPSANNFILASTSAGVRSWINPSLESWGSKWTTQSGSTISRASYVGINLSSQPLAPLHINGGGGVNKGIRLDNVSFPTNYASVDFYNGTTLIGQFFSIGALATAFGILTQNAIGLYAESTGPLCLGTTTTSPVVIAVGGTTEATVVSRFQRSGTYRGLFMKEQGGSPTQLAGHHGIYSVSSDSSLRSKDDGGIEHLLSSWRIGSNTRTLGLNVDIPASSINNVALSQIFISSATCFLDDTSGIQTRLMNNLFYNSASQLVLRYGTSAYGSNYIQAVGDHYWFCSDQGNTNSVVSTHLKLRLNKTGELIIQNTTSAIPNPSDGIAIYSSATDTSLRAKTSSGVVSMLNAWRIGVNSRTLGLNVNPPSGIVNNPSNFSNTMLSDVTLLLDDVSGVLTRFCNNTYFDGTQFRAIKTGGSSYLVQGNGSFSFVTAASVTSGSVTDRYTRVGIQSTGEMLFYNTTETIPTTSGAASVYTKGTGTASKLYGKDGEGNECLLTALRVGVNTRTLGLNNTPPSDVRNAPTIYSQTFISESSVFFDNVDGVAFRLMNNVYYSSGTVYRQRINGYGSTFYVPNDGNHDYYGQVNVGLGVDVNPVLRMRLSNIGNIQLFNVTGTVTAEASSAKLYCTGNEMYVMDAAGNATQISPHNKNGEWIYNSKNIKTKKHININMEKLIRFLENYHGVKFIEEFMEE